MSALLLAQALLALLSLPVLAACGYLGLLTLLSAKLPVPPASSRRLRFEIIVPAHNEAALIGRCLASLNALDWPAAQRRLTVVADNCDDATAALALAAGAQVLARHEPGLRGKGYALRHGFEQAGQTGWADALVVIDADSLVSPGLLEAFAARLEQGAEAVQAHFGVLDAGESWRTGLLAIAHGAFHGVRSRGRERLGLSCGLRGNGWCLRRSRLQAVPYGAFSVAEDIEYGISLGLAGTRVHYTDEGWVATTAESREPVARIQRQRWEGGRADLIRSQTLPLLRAAMVRRSRVCLDLALDLLVLPLSSLALQVLGLLAVTTLLSLWQPALWIWLWPGLFCALSLVAYVLRGWQLSGRGAAGLLDLLRAPFFILWKLGAGLGRRRGARIWIPTLRRRS